MDDATAQTTHPDEETIVAFAHHRLGREAAEQLEIHLDRCDECSEVVAATVKLLSSSSTQGDGAAPLAESPQRVEALGRFLLLHPLGAGAMGTVYAAYDPDLDRKVALKLLRPNGGDTPAGVRVLREAQAMARLSHPNVIPVYEVGSIDGQVFIAMELVEGPTLTVWLRERRRPWREILEVFLQAGRGLAAAHAAGLVHRDFKPDNVLVGADGRVRVTDFGLAQHSRELRAGTAGTPAYMAPEQLSGIRATAASDQFSFCVALYEALCGHRPGPAEASGSRSTAGRRDSYKSARVPAFLLRRIARGLTPIAGHRYPSMDTLIAALQNDPRRQWLSAGVAVAVLLIVAAAALAVRHARGQQALLCTGAAEKLAVAWNPAARQRVQEAFAAAGAGYAEQAWRAVERDLDDYSRAWTSMHTEACRATRIRGEQSERALDLRMACLDDRLSEVSALVRVFVQADAKVVRNAAEASSKLVPLSSCADLRSLETRAAPPLDRAAKAKAELVRRKLADAKAMQDAGKFHEELELAQAAVALAREVPDPALKAEALLRLGKAQDLNGDLKGAEPTLEEATLAAQASGDAKLLLDTFSQLSYQVGRRLGRFDEGRRWLSYARAALERYGSQDDSVASFHFNAASLFQPAGRPADAEAELRLSIAVREKLHGKDSLSVASALNLLSVLLYNQGKFDESLEVAHRALRIFEAVQGPEHPHSGSARNNLGIILEKQGRPAASLVELRRAAEIFEKTFGRDTPEYAAARGNMGNAYLDQGALDAAEAEYEYVRRFFEKRVGPDHPAAATADVALARVAKERGDLLRARKLAQRAVVKFTKAAGPQNMATAEALQVLAETAVLARQYDDAFEIYRRIMPLVPPTTQAEVLADMGGAYLALKQPTKAIEQLEKSLEMHIAQPGQPSRLAEARFALARALTAAGRDPERARSLALAARDAYLQADRADKQRTVETWLARQPAAR